MIPPATQQEDQDPSDVEIFADDGGGGPPTTPFVFDATFDVTFN